VTRLGGLADGGVEVIGRCATPRGEIQLQRRGEHFELISGGTFLVASYGGSEARLAHAALAELSGTAATVSTAPAAPALAVLVAGLGLGLTLRAILDDRRVGRVDVVELEAAVIAWNRGPLRGLSGDALADPRVRVIAADFLQLIAVEGGPLGAYDVVLVDIDNGPAWTVRDANRSLYSARGLAAVAGRMRDGGVMALWSASRDRGFETALAAVFPGFTVRRVAQRLGPGSGARRAWSYIYAGRRAHRPRVR
jgi:spermidine synthase